MRFPSLNKNRGAGLNPTGLVSPIYIIIFGAWLRVLERIISSILEYKNRNIDNFNSFGLQTPIFFIKVSRENLCLFFYIFNRNWAFHISFSRLSTFWKLQKKFVICLSFSLESGFRKSLKVSNIDCKLISSVPLYFRKWYEMCWK